MTVTAIIPARGGSKGIRRKNLAMLAGRPLIAWTIEQAKSATLVDEVIVSTDCRDIGEVAVSYGAEWFLRGDEAATDTASSESALREVLDVLDYKPELVVFLQCTSPFRQPTDIDNAIRLLVETGADSLFSGRRVEGYTWTRGQSLTPNYYDRERRQVQSVRRLEENGSIYVFRPQTLSHYGRRLGGAIECYEMHPLDSFQIDCPEDLELMESLAPSRLAQWLSLST